MSSLVVKMPTHERQSIDDAALKAGFSRMEEGEIRGNASLLIKLIAQALPGKSAEEIRSFLGLDKPRQQ